MATKEDLLIEDDEKELKDEELVITEEDPSKKPELKEDRDQDEDDEKDAKSVKENDEEDGKDDNERAAIRERRRLEKLERKERREKAISRDKLELDFLRKRNDELERRFIGLEQRQQQFDLTAVDTKLREALNEVDMADKVIAKAVEQGKGEDVVQAMKYRDQAIQRANQLQMQKQQATQRQPEQPGLDIEVKHHAQEFLKENPWYDLQGRDEDSAIMLAIDQTVIRDGYDPRTAEYWDELRSRAARRLPEKFKQTSRDRDNGDDGERQERRPRGGPAVGSGREAAPASTRKEVYISPERKQALIDAGVWDDPVLRMKYVKRYAEYDRQNRA
jgi:hypothetical protein